MIGTAYTNDHTLWNQIVQKENNAKARYEFLTGETSAKKFYNGSNKKNVDSKLQTFSKDRMQALQKPSNNAGSSGRPMNKRSSQSNHAQKEFDRYSTASKGDILSRALEQVLSEKQRSKHGSSAISQSTIPRPFVNTTYNARTWRDVDSQADRYRNQIRTCEKLQMQSLGHAAKTVMHRPGKDYPEPHRVGVFERNIKDGVKYQDAKTKARKFEIDKISQAYNPNRHSHVDAATALVDPFVTIRHESALPAKDPGYVPLTNQETFRLDQSRRVITDYTGKPIIKVDQEGGIFDEQLGQGAFRNTGYAGPRMGGNATERSRTVKAINNKKLQGLLTHDSNQKMSDKFHGVQTALQTVGRGGSVTRDITDVDSTLSTRGLMQRKLYLMKMMLKNEKNATQMMKKQLGMLDREMHTNNTTVRKLEHK